MPNCLATLFPLSLKSSNVSSFFSAVAREASGVWGEIATRVAPSSVILASSSCNDRSSRLQKAHQPPR